MKIKKLADAIFKRIYVDGPFTLDQLEERAKEKNIPINDFYAAMEIVQRHRKLQVSGKTYKKRVNKKQEFQSHLAWVKNNYPRMIPGVDDASHPIFDDVDFSYLFMTPDEAKEYRLSLKSGYAGRKNTKRNPHLFET